MACVAFPTCGLAMAESERYLPTLINKIEEILDEAGLNEEEDCNPHVRMSKWMKYNMYLGGGFAGKYIPARISTVNIF